MIDLILREVQQASPLSLSVLLLAPPARSHGDVGHSRDLLIETPRRSRRYSYSSKNDVLENRPRWF
jgi:hypothetical protein